MLSAGSNCSSAGQAATRPCRLVPHTNLQEGAQVLAHGAHKAQLLLKEGQRLAHGAAAHGSKVQRCGGTLLN